MQPRVSSRYSQSDQLIWEEWPESCSGDYLHKEPGQRALDLAERDHALLMFMLPSAPGLLERHARQHTAHAALLAEIRSLLAGDKPAPPPAGPRQPQGTRGGRAGSARLLGDRHPGTVAAAGRLVGALLAAGQAAEAVPWAEWVLTARTDGPGA